MKFIVYGKATCPYCVKANALLKKLGMDFEKHDVSNPDKRNELISYLKDHGIEARTIPQILLTKDSTITYIGGYTDLETFLNDTN